MCCSASADEVVLWSTAEVRCLLVAYDESRVQLRLVRPLGTVKTDLFSSRSEALVTAQGWRQQLARDLEANQHAFGIE
jgi:hypothetical protein